MVISIGFAVGESAPAQKMDDPIAKCPDYVFEAYKITPYLKLAISLQSMPIDKRAEKLREWASDPKNRYERQLHVICQMLFCRKDGSSVIRPSSIGASGAFERFQDRPEYYGPITIYKGCPIAVSDGYRLGGMPLPSSVIVETCIENNLWRESKYKMLSVEQQKKIINGFLKDKEWKDLIAHFDAPEFFTKQAEQGEVE